MKKVFAKFVVILIILKISAINSSILNNHYEKREETENLEVVTRKEWGAVGPKSQLNQTQLKLPIGYVIIHQTATGKSNDLNFEEMKTDMKKLEENTLDERDDLG